MAAGQGFKTFAVGEVLSAANVNGYLMQGVLVFADATARNAEITSPQEGQACYLKDTNQVLTYSGSAWVAVGGSSSPLTTKGDLYGFSTVDARIPIGTNGQILTADSTQSLGLKWATPAGGGKVLQYKMFQYATGVTNSTTTYTNTNLTLAITPTLNTSKILIFVSQPYQKGADAGYAGDIALFRDATSLTSNAFLGYVELANANMVTTHSINYLDAPATTSEITYRTKLRSSTTKAFTTCAGDSPAQITLLEMGA